MILVPGNLGDLRRRVKSYGTNGGTWILSKVSPIPRCALQWRLLQRVVADDSQRQPSWQTAGQWQRRQATRSDKHGPEGRSWCSAVFTPTCLVDFGPLDAVMNHADSRLQFHGVETLEVSRYGKREVNRRRHLGYDTITNEENRSNAARPQPDGQLHSVRAVDLLEHDHVDTARGDGVWIEAQRRSFAGPLGRVQDTKVPAVRTKAWQKIQERNPGARERPIKRARQYQAELH